MHVWHRVVGGARVPISKFCWDYQNMANSHMHGAVRVDVHAAALGAWRGGADVE